MTEAAKRSKFRLNAGHPRDALTWAKLEINHRNTRTSAIALHLAARAQVMLGNRSDALDYFKWSEATFQQTARVDVLGLVITARDHELYKLQSCTLAIGRERSEFEAICLARLHELCTVLESLYQTARIELELAVTKSFITRAELVINRLDRIALDRLVSEWEIIRELRGRTKPGYELDALDLVITLSESPVIPDEHLRRALRLSLTVRNAPKTVKYAVTPILAIGTRAVRRFFE